MKNIFLLAVVSLSFFGLNACASQPIAHVEKKFQNFSVSEYKVQIKPNFLDQSIKGTTELSLNFDPGAKESLYNVNDLVIDEVKSDLGDLEWKQSGSKLEIRFSQIPKKITIQYHGKPMKGLNWGDQFVYSAYFTCHWMICDEEPSPKSKFDLTLIVPSNFKATSLGIKRSIIYSKAALFMDALRTEMGEKDFWKGFKIFTQQYAYQSIESRDFQVVMQSVTDRSLNSLFDKWVY